MTRYSRSTGVRALQELARRLLAQHVAAAGRGQQEGRVRLARRRLLGRDRPFEARQPRLEVFRQRRRIDLRGLVRERGHVQSLRVIPRNFVREDQAEARTCSEREPRRCPCDPLPA